MSSKEFLGRNKENQAIALGVLKQEGRLDYDGLQEELELNHEDMQEVMRGIKYNGLARERSTESGSKYYEPGW